MRKLTPFDLMLRKVKMDIVYPEFIKDMVNGRIVVTPDQMARYTAGLLGEFMEFQRSKK